MCIFIELNILHTQVILWWEDQEFYQNIKLKGHLLH